MVGENATGTTNLTGTVEMSLSSPHAASPTRTDDGEFEQFEDLAGKVVQVPKDELNKQRAAGR